MRLDTLARNKLLAAVEPHELHRLATQFRCVDLSVGMVLVKPGIAIDTVYFPVSGMITHHAPGATEGALGFIGRDGCSVPSAILGIDRIPLQAIVTLRCLALAVDADTLLARADPKSSLYRCLMNYAHVSMMQSAGTAYANGHNTVEQRLARCILMLADRLDHPKLAFTHSFLASLLDTRRPGVTVGLHVLEGHGCIRAQRQSITITNREVLMSIAGPSYGLAEAEYARLLPARSIPPAAVATNLYATAAGAPSLTG